jgi:hypothetical protein
MFFERNILLLGRYGSLSTWDLVHVTAFLVVGCFIT